MTTKITYQILFPDGRVVSGVAPTIALAARRAGRVAEREGIRVVSVSARCTAPADPTEPTAAPDDGRGYHWTRAALEQYEMTRDQSEHADAIADYMIREGYYRDTRPTGISRREIAMLPVNDIRAYVAADDLARGLERSVRFRQLTPASLEVYRLGASQPVTGATRQLALNILRASGAQPPRHRVCYLGVPVTRGEVDWRA